MYGGVNGSTAFDLNPGMSIAGFKNGHFPNSIAGKTLQSTVYNEHPNGLGIQRT